MHYLSSYSFLDRSAVMLWSEHGGCHNPWRLCTVTQIEELKILMRMFPIWATGITFFTVCAQNSSMFIEQGMVLNNQVGPFKIPPATLSSLDVISIVVWVPIYERFIVPIARRLTGKERGFSELQRMGIGLFVSTIAVAVAALVEIKRLENARSEDLIYQKVPVPMSILWQAPQYLLIGVGEVFTSIGQAEFFTTSLQIPWEVCAPLSPSSPCLSEAISARSYWHWCLILQRKGVRPGGSQTTWMKAILIDSSGSSVASALWIFLLSFILHSNTSARRLLHFNSCRLSCFFSFPPLPCFVQKKLFAYLSLQCIDEKKRKLQCTVSSVLCSVALHPLWYLDTISYLDSWNFTFSFC